MELNRHVDEYSKVLQEIEQLQQKADVLKEQIREEIDRMGIGKLPTNAGTFFYSERKKYEYPQDIKNMEYEIKELKKEYERDAEYEINKIFSFKKASKDVED